MNSNKPFLDSIFDNYLSSVYRKDNGMLNSNLFVILNAYSEVFNDMSRKSNVLQGNVYIPQASPAALEDNFGFLIDFPKPPSFNTRSDGNEVYRAMLKTLFSYLASGSTVATMDSSVTDIISLLEEDPNTAPYVRVQNFTEFAFDAAQIELSYNAVATGSATLGPAEPSDIFISPTGLTITGYDDPTKTITFFGTPLTGVQYTISYYRDTAFVQGTNWMNLTDPTDLNVSPMNLAAGNVSTYYNSEFSYWWSEYNTDGTGVEIDSFQINPEDSSLIWRLPTKSVRFESPFDGRLINRTYQFYNESGTVFDITKITDINPDVLFNDEPNDYQQDVSAKSSNYFIRYSNNNNGPNPAFSVFSGSFNQYRKRFESIEFPSNNVGTLDLFEKGDNFNQEDLFGYGTKNIWLDVAYNANKEAYVIDNSKIFERDFSLHEHVNYFEGFEGGTLKRISTNYSSGTRITDLVGSPINDKDDCLMIMSSGTGTATYVSPIVTGNNLTSTNHIEIDFFDPINSGTNTYIDITNTGTTPSEYHRLRFGVEPGNVILIPRSDPGQPLFTLEETKPFGFVETFFASSGSTNYSIETSSPYVLATGNPFSVSDFSFESGGLGNLIFPSGDSDLVVNADYIELNFEASGTGFGPFLVFSRYKHVDFGSGDYGANDQLLLFDNGVGNWDYSLNVQSVTGTSLITTSNGGNTSIPSLGSGTHNIKIFRGDKIEIDGTAYPIGDAVFPDPSGNPALFWDEYPLGGNAASGTSSNPYNDGNELGNNNSFLLLADSNLKINHYVFGNQVLREEFEEQNAIAISSFTFSGNINTPYFYQEFTNPSETIAPKIYLNQYTRDDNWKRLTVETDLTGRSITAYLGESVFYENSDIGFSGTLAGPSGIQLINQSDYPQTEFSYFDNIKLSYYDRNNLLPEYDAVINLTNDWQGSNIDYNAVIDNKYLALEPVPNFQFAVNILGLSEEYISIVTDIINKVKPAHTITVPIFLLEQELDTTSQLPAISDPDTDWETGNISKNVEIAPTTPISVTGDVEGLIKPSGLS